MGGGTALDRAIYAELLLAANDIERAKKEIELALNVDPDNYGACITAGLCAMAEDDVLVAYDHFLKAQTISPEESEPYHNLAQCFSRRHQPKEALRLAEKVYFMDPSRATYVLSYGQRLYENFQFEKAAEFGERAVTMAPNDLMAHELRARCRLRQGNTNKAVSDFASYVSRNKESRPLYVLTQIMRECGRTVDALNISKEWLKNNPKDVMHIGMYLDCVMSLADFDGARDGTPQVKSYPTSVYTNSEEVFQVGAGQLLLACRFLLQKDGSNLPLYAEGDAAILMSMIPGIEVLPLENKPIDAVSLSSLVSHNLHKFGNQPPNQPYLKADEDRLRVWQAGLSEHRRPIVGILWHNATYGISIENMATALAGIATPISLAVGDEIRRELSGYTQILDGGAHINSPADLVAAIAAVDVVLVVDALAAYVAGALGKPGIVVLSPNINWAWAQKNNETVWFPSMQTIIHDFGAPWESLVPEIRRRMRILLGQQLEIEQLVDEHTP